MLATGGCVFIERGDHERARESLRKAAERIRNGLCMVVFPEGTRSKDGHLLEFKKGPFHLAAEARVPIVPVALIGTSALLPSGSMGIQSGEVVVRFGEPLEIKEDETHVEIAARTRVALEKLLAAA